MNNILKNINQLTIKDLPELEEINISNETIFGISENRLENWLVKNHYNIYDVKNKNCITYEDVINLGLTPSYPTIYDMTSSLGFTNIFLDKVTGNDIDEESYTFKGKILTEEVLYNLYNHFNCEVVFLIDSKE